MGTKGSKRRIAHEEPAEPEWLAALDAMLAAAGHDTNHRPNMIEFTSYGDLVTRVRLRGHGTTPAGGPRLEAVADVSTALPEGQVSPPSEAVELCNRMAVLGALVSGSARGVPHVCTRIPFPAGDEAEVRLRLGLLRAASLLQAPWLLKCLAWLDGRESEARLALPGAREPSLATAAELKKAEKLLDERDIFCDAGRTRLQAEFRCVPGAARAAQCDLASRLTVDTAAGHPIFGAGLSYELELPEEIGARGHAVAERLNALEAASSEPIPSLGAWCRTLDGRGIAHVGFVPNSAYSSGLASGLCLWEQERSGWAREQILIMDGE